MAITQISRDWGSDPSIVRIVSTNTLAEVATSGYILAQDANIQAINSGAFEWLASDMCLVVASDGWVFANISADFESLEPMVFSTTVVGAPVVVGNFASFASTGGNIEDLGYLPSDAAKTKVVMAGSAVQVGYIAHFVDTSGTIDDTAGAVQNAGSIYAGLSGTAGVLRSYPAGATSGYLGLTGVANAADYAVQISNASFGQAAVVSIPDPGASTANFLLNKGINDAISVQNLKYGATPVAQVDPASCTITAAAGASNHCTITVQLKDGSATNMARVIPFKVYLATDNTGLTLQSAASTGYSVTSGGVKDPTGSTTITQGLAVFSSATGGCVIDLLDTGKGTGNLILMLPNGFKASAAITSGSYGA